MSEHPNLGSKKEIDLKIRINSFTKPETTLKFKNDTITYNESEIKLEEVIGLKYGTESIQFDMFQIGQKYIIDLQTKDREFSIVLKSLLGIKSGYFSEIYSEIIECIYSNIMLRLVNEAIDRLINGESVFIDKYQITPTGILINNELIIWSNLSFQRNYDRLTINDKNNPKVWTNLYYTKTYNTDVLAAIVDWVINHNGIEELKSK